MTLTTRDLFEMASLDVLGLLDEDERRDFEQALRASPPEVQAQIRREQLRMADLEAWLPDVEPAPGLRARVLGALHEAIAAVRDGRTREHLARRVGPFTLALQRNVSPLWRAAAVALLASTVVLGFNFYRVIRDYGSINDQLVDTAASQRLAAAFGPDAARVFVDPGWTRVAFTARGESRAAAAIFINEDSGRAKLMVSNLPSIEGGYRLVLLDAQGAIAGTLDRFDSTGPDLYRNLSETLQPKMAFAILPDVAGDDLSAAVLVANAV